MYTINKNKRSNGGSESYRVLTSVQRHIRVTLKQCTLTITIIHYLQAFDLQPANYCTNKRSLLYSYSIIVLYAGREQITIDKLCKLVARFKEWKHDSH